MMDMRLALKLSCELIKEIKDKHKPEDGAIALMQITSETDIIPRQLENIVDEAVCPICQEVFRYRISQENSHFEGKCEKESCLSIIE